MNIQQVKTLAQTAFTLFLILILLILAFPE